jgi:hypothetical protein
MSLGLVTIGANTGRHLGDNLIVLIDNVGNEAVVSDSMRQYRQGCFARTSFFKTAALGAPLAAWFLSFSAQASVPEISPVPAIQIQTSSSQETYVESDFEHKYSVLYQALDFMASREEDENMFIEPSVASRGNDVLGTLQQLGVTPPKVFTHSSESVVFSWKLPDQKVYLTVSEGLGFAESISDANETYIIGEAEVGETDFVQLIYDLGTYLGGRTGFVA